MAALWYRRHSLRNSGRRNYSALLEPVTDGVISRLAVGSAHPSSEDFSGKGGFRKPDAAPVGVARSSAFEKRAALDLPDSDMVTECHLERLASVLPVGAFYACAELVRVRHPRSPARYAVAVLNAWHRERRYDDLR